MHTQKKKNQKRHTSLRWGFRPPGAERIKQPSTLAWTISLYQVQPFYLLQGWCTLLEHVVYNSEGRAEIIPQEITCNLAERCSVQMDRCSLQRLLGSLACFQTEPKLLSYTHTHHTAAAAAAEGGTDGESSPQSVCLVVFPRGHFQVIVVYFPPPFSSCNTGGILNDLFSLRGQREEKKKNLPLNEVLFNEPRTRSFADGFSFPSPLFSLFFSV